MDEKPAVNERLLAWLDLIDAGERLARAGIRARLGPDCDEDAEYFRIVRKHSDEHCDALVRFAEEYSRRIRSAGKIERSAG